MDQGQDPTFSGGIRTFVVHINLVWQARLVELVKIISSTLNQLTHMAQACCKRSHNRIIRVHLSPDDRRICPYDDVLVAVFDSFCLLTEGCSQDDGFRS